MTIQTAIEKAIEGGWKTPDGLNFMEVRSDTILYSENVLIQGKGYEEIDTKWQSIQVSLLDPSFWKSLGKAMGWGKENANVSISDWLSHWHCFIDDLAEGKSIEEYFKQL